MKVICDDFIIDEMRKESTSSCMSVAEETSGKTIVDTAESFTEARALRSCDD